MDDLALRDTWIKMIYQIRLNIQHLKSGGHGADGYREGVAALNMNTMYCIVAQTQYKH